MEPARTRAVWKYETDIYRAANGWRAEIPRAARFLSVAKQYSGSEDRISVWFEVDPYAEKVLRMFTLFGTGHTILSPWLTYLGTTIHQGGELVLHLYIDTEGDR
jgi:hypothetical protein